MKTEGRIGGNKEKKQKNAAEILEITSFPHPEVWT